MNVGSMLKLRDPLLHLALQMQSLKRSLNSMAVDMTIKWATGMVELEGVDDDVHEVESVLSRITLQAD